MGQSVASGQFPLSAWIGFSPILGCALQLRTNRLYPIWIFLQGNYPGNENFDRLEWTNADSKDKDL